MHEVQRPPIRHEIHASPGSIDEALALLTEHGEAARVIAGGTDLMVELDQRVGAEVTVLVDLTRIQGLDTIEQNGHVLRLGPLVTHNQCATDAAVRAHALALAQASLEVGSPALRNRATVVGNLVTASPANDTISALLALDARLELTSLDGIRVVDLADFHVGLRRTVLQPGELVTAIELDIDTSATSVFVKAGLRRAQAISVVHVSVWCARSGDDGEIEAARVALGSVAPTVVRSSAAEAALVGTRLTPDDIGRAARAARASVQPIDDIRGTADYRSSLVEIMVRRGLESIAAGVEAAALAEAPVTLSGPVVTADGQAVTLGAGASIECRVNGQDLTAPWRPSSLLDWLREEAGLTGTKEGCAEGECGACTVHLDGAAVLACLVPAGRAHRSRIDTIEGLAGPDGLHPCQQAFVDAAAVQCGYCIPGFLMAAAALRAEREDPRLDDVKLAMSGNLCRCTGYYSIEAALTGTMPQREDPS